MKVKSKHQMPIRDEEFQRTVLDSEIPPQKIKHDAAITAMRLIKQIDVNQIIKELDQT